MSLIRNLTHRFDKFDEWAGQQSEGAMIIIAVSIIVSFVLGLIFILPVLIALVSFWWGIWL